MTIKTLQRKFDNLKKLRPEHQPVGLKLSEEEILIIDCCLDLIESKEYQSIKSDYKNSLLDENTKDLFSRKEQNDFITIYFEYYHKRISLEDLNPQQRTFVEIVEKNVKMHQSN